MGEREREREFAVTQGTEVVSDADEQLQKRDRNSSCTSDTTSVKKIVRRHVLSMYSDGSRWRTIDTLPCERKHEEGRGGVRVSACRSETLRLVNRTWFLPAHLLRRVKEDRLK